MLINFFDSPADIKRLVFYTYLKPVELLPLYCINKANFLFVSQRKFKFTSVEVGFSIGGFGSLTYLNWVTTFFRFNFKSNSRISEEAATKGHFDFLKAIYEDKYLFTDWAFNGAIQGGHLEIIKWLHGHGYKGNQVSSYAAKFNKLEVLKWLNNNGYPLYPITSSTAAKKAKGDLTILKWLYENRCEFGSECSLLAASKGDLVSLKWLHEIGKPLNEFVFAEAANSGNLEMLNWLEEKKCPWDHTAFWQSAKKSNFEVLKWLHEKKCPCDEYVAAYTAENGNLEILKWLKLEGFPFNVVAFKHAIYGNQLHVIEWLKEIGSPWHEGVSLSAAKNIEIFKWLVTNGCPWDKKVCLLSANDAVKEWIKLHDS